MFRKKKRLLEVMKWRRLGVELRNEIHRQYSPQVYEYYKTLMEEWTDGMISSVARLSELEAEWLRTLENVQQLPTINSLDYKGLKLLMVICERLLRMDIIIRKYLDLPQRPQTDGIYYEFDYFYVPREDNVPVEVEGPWMIND